MEFENILKLIDSVSASSLDSFSLSLIHISEPTRH
mgnify:CR=1 FL=1